jgi:hypothetical protein
MNVEQTRGRNLTALVALIIVAPQLLILLVLVVFGLTAGIVAQLVILALMLALGAALVAGRWWARAYSIYLFGGGALMLVGRPLLSGNILGAAIGLPIVALYVLAARMLWSSPSIEAYFDSKKKDEFLTLGGSHGV